MCTSVLSQVYLYQMKTEKKDFETWITLEGKSVCEVCFRVQQLNPHVCQEPCVCTQKKTTQSVIPLSEDIDDKESNRKFHILLNRALFFVQKVINSNLCWFFQLLLPFVLRLAGMSLPGWSQRFLRSYLISATICYILEMDEGPL